MGLENTIEEIEKKIDEILESKMTDSEKNLALQTSVLYVVLGNFDRLFSIREEIEKIKCALEREAMVKKIHFENANQTMEIIEENINRIESQIDKDIDEIGECYDDSEITLADICYMLERIALMQQSQVHLHINIFNAVQKVWDKLEQLQLGLESGANSVCDVFDIVDNIDN